LGLILVDEDGGVVAVGAVAPPAGGSDETDCAYAVAATPASNPKPKMVDFIEFGMPDSPVLDYLRVKI
jgi:hypothetical protein